MGLERGHITDQAGGTHMQWRISCGLEFSPSPACIFFTCLFLSCSLTAQARQQSEGSLIIFIVGGVTYSEIRSIYEVCSQKVIALATIDPLDISVFYTGLCVCAVFVLASGGKDQDK